MSDPTGKKLLRLLAPENPLPLRCAAALVLGEVGTKDKEVSDALCAVLDDPETTLRTEAITAVGKLRVERALPQLLTQLQAGGPAAEAAAHAAAHLGPKGIKALQELTTGALPHLRRRVAAALAAGGSAGAETAAVDALLDSDPSVIDAAARTLLGEVPSLDAAKRRVVADRILQLLQAKKGPRLPVPSEAALLRLLAGLGDPRGEAVFWSRVDAPQPTELRAAALQALGTLPPPSGATALKRLLAAAGAREFQVAAPALMLLRSLPVNAKTLKDWLPLLEAPDVGSRRFALEKLAGFDTSEVAAAVVSQLKHPDRALRDQALEVLSKLKNGRDALAEHLLEAETADDAWTLARAQATMARDYPAKLRTKLFATACTYLEAEDRRAEALLFLIREADARDLRDRLEERALALRKKKKYAEALHYLRLLGRDPACAESVRFEQAACGLKQSAHDLAPEARNADTCLHQFGRLIHSHETDPVVYIEKAAWLAPEDLFYLGFHFAEGKGPECDFAGKMLRLVLKRSPRTQLGRDAKSKLNSAGL
jgi:HEAT repeat protein